MLLLYCIDIYCIFGILFYSKWQCNLNCYESNRSGAFISDNLNQNHNLAIHPIQSWPTSNLFQCQHCNAIELGMLSFLLDYCINNITIYSQYTKNTNVSVFFYDSTYFVPFYIILLSHIILLIHIILTNPISTSNDLI